MPFMVNYNRSDGTSCYEQSDAIDEAALFVERLRNQEGIEQIRIFRMEEISFAFRPYYKVELGLPERQSADLSSSTAAPAPAAVEGNGSRSPVPAEASADDAAAAADGADGRRGLFGR